MKFNTQDSDGEIHEGEYDLDNLPPLSGDTGKVGEPRTKDQQIAAAVDILRFYCQAAHFYHTILKHHTQQARCGSSN